MSSEDARTASLHDDVASWVASHEDTIGSTHLRLAGVSGSSLLLQANSKRIQLSVPSSDEEVFLVTAADPNPDPSFSEALMFLNEKLERLQPERGSLFIAMEYLLTALKKLEPGGSTHSGYHKSGVDYADDDNDNDDEDTDEAYHSDYFRSDEVDFGYDMASIADASTPSLAFLELRYQGFLYAMAIEAKQQCEAAHSRAQNPCTSDALAWCIVKPDPNALMIHIKMQIGGIMHDDVAAASLGLPLDFPLRISLEFHKEFWCKKQFAYFLKIGACHVKALSNHGKDPWCAQASQKSDVDEIDKDRRHKFGEEILVPELVSCFFNYMERKDEIIAKSSDVLKELQKFTTMANPIVGLIHFLAARFRALPNWCIACWDTLPCKVGRLRTCEKDLCLYRFEELGLGAAILQELLKFHELIDFEISLALAAATSSRDVFEPFPAFLLENEEIRDRSGWFSKKAKPDARHKTVSVSQKINHVSSNKCFTVLKSILDSYPPLGEMQACNDELQLKKALTKLWHKTLDAPISDVHERWRRKAWLPYDVLRFLVSSNRLTMACLKESEQLQIEGVCYQFAVLLDNPEKETHFEKRRTENGGSFYAFHGSPAGNWFSILRNGLRSLSNTRYMSTGAAYGAGIYTARDMATSLGYATNGLGWKHGQMHNSFHILAICEIVNGSLISNGHSNSIMVVRPECEQDILIRYILVITGEVNRYRSEKIEQQILLFTGQGKQINLQEHHSRLRESYYTKQQKEWTELRKARWLSLSVIENEEERRLLPVSHPPILNTRGSCPSRGTPGCMQAIQKELKNITSQINAAKKKKLRKDAESCILGLIEIDVPDETNLQIWHVDLTQDLFKESPLYNDLVHRAKQNNQQSTVVKLECAFPDSFPMAPPFIRIMSPRFKFHTGHITVGGSICMELLTESGWSPAFCFESVLVQIVSAMMEGGARLDFSSSNFEYNVHEARAAFDRVARDHGWIKGKQVF